MQKFKGKSNNKSCFFWNFSYVYVYIQVLAFELIGV